MKRVSTKSLNLSSFRIKLRRPRRKGTIAVLAAILIVPLLAVVALSVDMGYVVRVTAEMQNAADSAALAGASKLLIPNMNGLVDTNTLGSTSVANARAEAKKFSVLNVGGGVNLTVPDSDIVVGYAPNLNQVPASLTPWTAGNPFPNSVQVTVRREASVNGSVSLFFSRVIGNSTWGGNMKATASYVPGNTAGGFKSWTNGPNGLLLPLTINYTLWTTFLATGRSPDLSIHDNYTAIIPTSSIQPPANVTGGGDQVPEFNDVYPNATAPGNFGLLSIGPPATDTPSYRNWIDNGCSPSDLDYFGPNGLQASLASPLSVAGGPGLKSTLQSNLQGVIGQHRVIPLHNAVTGTGSNTHYSIVGFAGVVIVEATGSGNNMRVVVQPAIVIDQTATSGTTSGGTTFVYATSPLSLTR